MPRSQLRHGRRCAAPLGHARSWLSCWSPCSSSLHGQPLKRHRFRSTSAATCARTQALLANSAFVAADSGDRICDQPCRVQLAFEDGGTLDRAFVLAAVSETGGRATSLLLRTAPTSLSAAYDEATEMLVALAFPDEEIALLDDWFRRAKHDARAAQSFLAHHQSTDCSLRLGILRADEDRRWKIALELSFD